MIYQERLLLYCDILGWSSEIRAGESSKLLAAVEKIHQRAEAHNERERETLPGKTGAARMTDDIFISDLTLEDVERPKLNAFAMRTQVAF
jgi:hypothetical protein